MSTTQTSPPDARPAPLRAEMGDSSADGLPQPQRFWAVLTIALGLLMAVLDGAIANLALPTIAQQLDVSAASSIWVVNAYQLANVMCLLPLAALGEIVGYRRVWKVGMVVFTLASLGCALSHSLPELIAARVLQGLGAAGMVSVNSALVRFVYPRRMLGQGFGLNMMVGSTSSALGPSIAAAILSVGGWQWLFAINIPLGALVLALGARHLPPTPRSSHKFDLGSAALNALTFGLLITGIEALGHGGHMEIALAEIAGGAVAGWLLTKRQVSRSNPLLPVDLLRRPIFALSWIAAACSFAASAMAVVCLPFYLQLQLGFSQRETGLLMTPWPLTVALLATTSGRLADRFSAGLIGMIGQGMMVVGLISLALLPDDPALWNIAWRMSLCGAGFSLFNAPNNRTMISAAPASRSGGASGMQATARLLGQTLGTAIVALLFGLMSQGATTVALLVAAVFSLISAGASVLRRPPPARA